MSENTLYRQIKDEMKETENEKAISDDEIGDEEFNGFE